MSKKIREEIRELVVEAGTDILYLTMDLITAPILAICRVGSDFIYSRGRYKRPDRGSPKAH